MNFDSNGRQEAGSLILEIRGMGLPDAPTISGGSLVWEPGAQQRPGSRVEWRWDAYNNLDCAEVTPKGSFIRWVSKDDCRR